MSAQFDIGSRGWASKDTRMKGIGWMKSEMKNHFVAAVGEFVGTVLFLFFAFAGTQVANVPVPTSETSTSTSGGSNPSLILYIALSFGFSLAVNAWVFYRISGGLFNPAVTFAMLLAGALPPMRAAWVFVAQMLGGLTAAALVSALFPGDLAVSTGLSGGCSVVQGLFIEMFLTAQLVITIFMLANEKTKATFLAPVGIGLSLFIAELAGVYYTGGSLNPARSFGPAVVIHTFPGYHWIYWLGPALGSILATAFYKFVKTVEYETANPDQDIDLSKESDSQHVQTKRAESMGLDEEVSRQQSDSGSKRSRSKESDLEAGLGVGNEHLVAPSQNPVMGGAVGR